MSGSALGLIAVHPTDATVVRVLSVIWPIVWAFLSFFSFAFAIRLHHVSPAVSVPVAAFMFLGIFAGVILAIIAVSLCVTLRREGNHLYRLWGALRIFWLLVGLDFFATSTVVIVHCFASGEIPDDDPLADLAAPAERASFFVMGLWAMGLAWITSYERRSAFTAFLSKFAARSAGYRWDPDLLEPPRTSATHSRERESE
jgi:hypothetical protein